jgi:hypothetical protein
MVMMPVNAEYDCTRPSNDMELDSELTTITELPGIKAKFCPTVYVCDPP